MPTVILLDASLSMLRPVHVVGQPDTTRKKLAIAGIKAFLDRIHLYNKLEFISLVIFSSHCEERCGFTRDYNQIKSELNNVEDFDKTILEVALSGVNQLVLNEWGNNTACQVLLITDGNIGLGSHSLKNILANLPHRPATLLFPLPFSFPSKLHVVCVTSTADRQWTRSQNLYQRLIDINGSHGSLISADNLTESSIISLFTKLAEELYTPFKAALRCGHLESKIILSPSPVSIVKTTDFESHTYSMSHALEVCGFVSIADIGSPMAVSRHLVLPSSGGSSSGAHPFIHPLSSSFSSPSSNGIVGTECGNVDDATKAPLTAVSDDTMPPSGSSDESKKPSFCVLLHGALKVENMAALVQLCEDSTSNSDWWFGFIYSWADSRKKSNLMLTVLDPGADVIPWLGDLRYLATGDCMTSNVGVGQFPIRPQEKRSYAQNSIVWIRQAGLQSDIQKILRHARKLPEKTQQFYKELNRLRKAAISLGFLDLLNGLAYIFEQELMQLPGTASPDCSLQLQHAADMLRKTQNRDVKYLVPPLQTSFNTT